MGPRGVLPRGNLRLRLPDQGNDEQFGVNLQYLAGKVNIDVKSNEKGKERDREAAGVVPQVESEDAEDDTSINGIELFCRTPQDAGHDGHSPKKEAREFSITSNFEKWGEWRGEVQTVEDFEESVKRRDLHLNHPVPASR